jgi:putative MATE family efflux protein
MDHAKQLGEVSVGRLLLKFSIPAIVGLLSTALYNIIDRIFVGHGVGLQAITATTVVFPITIIILAFGLMIGIGASVTISIKLGQNNREEAEHVLGNAFSLTIIISVIATVLGLIFQEDLLELFGASKEVLPLAKQFVTIILAGTLFQIIGLVFNNIIRSEGNPTMAMIIMVAGTVLNTALNPLFIFVLHMGIRGSALATVISQIITSIWMLTYFIGKNSALKFKIKYFVLNLDITRQILSIGMSAFIFQVISSVITIIFNQSLKASGGDVAIAAMGIINSIAMLILMPIFGVNQGAQPIIGYNYGAKKFDRVRKTMKLAIIAATCIATAGFIVVELFPRQILSLFSSQNAEMASMLDIGTPAIRVFLMMLPITGLPIVGSNFYQAIGKARVSIFLSLSKQVLFQVPLLFILPHYFKLMGIWAAGPVSDLLSALLIIFFLAHELGKNRLEQESILLGEKV